MVYHVDILERCSSKICTGLTACSLNIHIFDEHLVGKTRLVWYIQMIKLCSFVLVNSYIFKTLLRASVPLFVFMAA